MLTLRLALSKGIGDIPPLLRISSQNYEVCKSCLIKRHLNLPTWFPQKLKNGLDRISSSSSVRWQTDGTSRNGGKDSKSKQENTTEPSVIKASSIEGKDVNTTTKDTESASPPHNDDGSIVISFDYKEGLPLHHQLQKCMEDQTLRITHSKGKEINVEDEKFSWPVFPKNKSINPFDEDEKLIEEERALREYMLSHRNLKNLRYIRKRNAYRNTDKKYVTMYSVSDLHKKTIDVWGSIERMEMQRKRHKNRYGYQDDFRIEEKMESNSGLLRQTITSAPGKVVLSAIVANLVNAGFKGFAWLSTGSHSMFAEMIHSCVDAINQIFMLFGLYSSNKAPDSDHPYGYKSAKFVFSFTAGISIFFFGGLINVGLGMMGFMSDMPYHYSVWALLIPICATFTEGGSLLVACQEAFKKMPPNERNLRGLQNFVQQGLEPSMTVVLLEDFAAVVGNIVALGCYYIGSSFGPSLVWIDSLGSVIIGGLLGAVGMVIIRTNYSAIVEKSVPPHEKEAIQYTMESDPIVRSVHDMKVVNDRVKAEIDYNGREITSKYLLEQNMSAILQEMQYMSNEKDAEEFLKYHGDNVINQLGMRVDGLETRIKSRHPKVRHVDLESL
ncbi:zinc transporter 9-like [Pecten maximus]|uniref:zinc transporter 9-like n=1 Tax=Pecten maximus TaxID=6579 RepID=UPI001458B981|nr:zinc transporter 9-like [Pecten maximus]XP_033743521.1 zinc transporter 9-like [Pecten maximus]XP_033743523.1 zinc transporter 9-like [Pecten maximus]XP_033743524.1 zinc transporter 9-like [Pecten maximus]XP_033743525.1 zinc transporter 9-like [Pecten maximus]